MNASSEGSDETVHSAGSTEPWLLADEISTMVSCAGSEVCHDI